MVGVKSVVGVYWWVGSRGGGALRDDGVKGWVEYRGGGVKGLWGSRGGME